MDVPDIEFITINDTVIKEEIELKVEYLDDAEADGSTNDVYGYNAKCGEILVSTCGDFTLVCAFCDDEFVDMPSFGSHIHLKHLNDDLCEIPTVKLAKRFEEVHAAAEVENDIPSNYTDDSQYSIESLPNDESIEIIAMEPDFFCTICNQQFGSSAALSSHQNLHNVRSLEIVEKRPTGKVIAAKTDSKSSPVRKAPGDPDMFCDLCNHQFKSKGALRGHGSRHGNLIPLALQQDPNYLKCKFCNEEFTEALERVSHEKAHGPNERYICSYCPKNFRTNFQRRLHIYTHTGERPYKCKMCPSAFASVINRLQHERIHLGIKPYFCEICNKRFVSSTDRAIHIRSHTGEKPYQCDECGGRFPTSSRLCAHKRRHTNIRDFKCDVCGIAFFYNYDLTKHKISHTDIRPFKCTDCGRDFQRRKALVNHRQIHSEVKQYSCHICGKKFAQLAGLHSHKKTHGEMVGAKASE